jgi:hypothetical protein
MQMGSSDWFGDAKLPQDERFVPGIAVERCCQLRI